jgi:hypothetical protein
MAKKILTALQEKFISLLAKNKTLTRQFYLTGGTALFPKLIKLARSKFDSQIDPIQLGAQLIKAKDIQDLPRMLVKIDHGLWRNFFFSQAKSLSKQIFK